MSDSQGFDPLDVQLERFEQCWREDVPDIAEFLPEGVSKDDRVRLLCELIMIDQERR